jgi:DNA-binding IclR family transcriptional regulator
MEPRTFPFGSRTRTSVLVALCLIEESFPRELARLLETSLHTVQRALEGLELAGLVAGRTAGRTRLYRLEPRYFAHRELVSYLRRLAEAEPALEGRIVKLRRRPRRAGKPL